MSTCAGCCEHHWHSPAAQYHQRYNSGWWDNHYCFQCFWCQGIRSGLHSQYPSPCTFSNSIVKLFTNHWPNFKQYSTKQLPSIWFTIQYHDLCHQQPGKFVVCTVYMSLVTISCHVVRFLANAVTQVDSRNRNLLKRSSYINMNGKLCSMSIGFMLHPRSIFDGVLVSFGFSACFQRRLFMYRNDVYSFWLV